MPKAIAQAIPSSPNPANPPYKTVAPLPTSKSRATSRPRPTDETESTTTPLPKTASTSEFMPSFAQAKSMASDSRSQPFVSSNIGLSFSLDNPQTASSSTPASIPSGSGSVELKSEPNSVATPTSTLSPTTLSFDISALPAPTPKAIPPADSPLPLPLAQLFVGDSHSLAAIAIGSAEGTRTPEGGKTWAFKGHTDPGNGVWNLGTFSWQHGASSPEEADRKQLARLQRQAKTLNRQAIALGVPWGLAEQLNALDLANQSPMAALNRGGYLERLKQAYDQEGLTGTEAILWARTWSYRHPSGTRWNAPGLGNTHHGIRTDQKRRMTEVAKAIAAQTAPQSVPETHSDLAPKATSPTNKGIDILFDLFRGQEVLS